jgi:hypothetical protein
VLTRLSIGRRLRAASPRAIVLVGASALFAAWPFGTDVSLYEHYAKQAVASPALHAFPVEYPAASLAAFVAPLALALPYRAGFALAVAIAVIALVVSSDGIPEHPGWSSRTSAYLLLGPVAVLFARYDAFPALAAFLAVEGARRQRWGRAWAWAVVGGLLKLFPFLLLPGFLLAERSQTGRWPVRRAGAAVAAAACVAATQQVLAPGSEVSPISYELHRGFELSSLPGSLSLLVDPLGLHWTSGFGSIEVVGTNHALIATVVTAAGVAALAIVWALAWRDMLSVEAVSLAVLSVAILSDKAFAPQYLIWVAPLWAYWPMRRGWVVAAVLTALVYPVLYSDAIVSVLGYDLATTAAAVRNGVLLVATVRWLSAQVRPALSGREAARWWAPRRRFSRGAPNVGAARFSGRKPVLRLKTGVFEDRGV